MRPVSAGIVSFLFVVVVPGTVAGYVPWALTRWRMETPFAGWEPGRFLGLLLLAPGALALLDSVARFAREGRGTPAPVLPTERLVISGLYRFVRNPMYVAVLCVILGQALWFGSRTLLVYAGCLAAAFHAFVCLYEEPTLRRRYGADYVAYCAAVRRWVPRLGSRATQGAGETR